MVASSRDEMGAGNESEGDTVKSLVGDIDGLLISGNNVIYMHTLAMSCDMSNSQA